jgi:beta-lactam-binding protein with PASTA domain/predicted Ser/Thr protein kinase
VTTNDRPAIINERYELIKRIGRGGMADVFMARDRLLDRNVAIKVLFAEFAVDPNFVERFRREAQAAANLNHPNIVNVFDWGKHGGTYFIAMEYVDGRTLADILRSNGQLTSKQAAEIASEVAAALGFAHAAGLVHRDIKPANILIGTNGSVKVADFGIARAMNAPTEANLTQAGAVMGTATYFSPEQAQGAQPDPRSDLYSLGIVMYEMIAGRPRFAGDNPVSIAYKQVHDYPTPLNKLVADVPRPFEAIVAKLLTKDPAVRYSTADSLREDLRRFRAGERPVALAAASRTGQTPTVVGGAVPGRGPDSQMNQRTSVQGRVPGGGQPTGQRPHVVVPNRYREPQRTGWYALAAFFALVALGLGGFLLFNTLTGGEEGSDLEMPNYIGQPFATVSAELTRQRINFTPIEQENTQQANGVVDEGLVWRTDPEPGVVRSGDDPVQIFYNPTSAEAVIPQVIGLSVTDARARLSEAGFFEIAAEDEAGNPVTSGTVTGSDPDEGETLKVDEQVTLIVGADGATDSSISETTEPGQFQVPHLIGDSRESALEQLDEAGLEVDVVTVEDARPQWDGNVMDQTPRSPTMVSEGDTVQIIVGEMPDEPATTQPPQTNPPATNPPATNPPATNPPATNPPATNPPTTPAPATTTTVAATTTTV